MGEVRVRFVVMNDRDTSLAEEVEFLADSGATRAWIGEEIAERLQIEPQGQTPVELADGQVVDYPYGLCKFRYDGELVNGSVIIGPRNCEPLAGTHVLEDFRLKIDLIHHTVVRVKAMRAKKTGGNCRNIARGACPPTCPP